MDVKEELSEQKTLITDVMSPKSGSIVTLNSQENDVNRVPLKFVKNQVQVRSRLM